MPRLLTRGRKSSYCLGFLQLRPNCVSEISKKNSTEQRRCRRNEGLLLQVLQLHTHHLFPTPTPFHKFPNLPLQINHPQLRTQNRTPSTLLNHLNKTSQSTLCINTHHSFETLLPRKPDSRLDRRGLTKRSASETTSCPRAASAGTHGSSPAATAGSPATA